MTFVGSGAPGVGVAERRVTRVGRISVHAISHRTLISVGSMGVGARLSSARHVVSFVRRVHGPCYCLYGNVIMGAQFINGRDLRSYVGTAVFARASG